LGLGQVRSKVPTPPRLTNEQRRQAFEKALKLRQDRARLKDSLSEPANRVTTPVVRFIEAFCEAEIAQGMKVYDLLTALPHIGRGRALALLEQAGFKHPEKTTVRATGPRQRERLFELLAAKSPR
jgi:hypothetical protein